MLPKGQHVRDVFTNPSNGLLSIPQGGSRKIFLECSTIEVATSVEVRKLVAESGLGMFVDAPVSGGPKGSDAGTLTFMVGGSEDEVKTVKPILELMGKNIFHCGGAGAGLATKCLNNYAAWVSFLGLCEGRPTSIDKAASHAEIRDSHEHRHEVWSRSESSSRYASSCCLPLCPESIMSGGHSLK